MKRLNNDYIGWRACPNARILGQAGWILTPAWYHRLRTNLCAVLRPPVLYKRDGFSPLPDTTAWELTSVPYCALLYWTRPDGFSPLPDTTAWELTSVPYCALLYWTRRAASSQTSSTQEQGKGHDCSHSWGDNWKRQVRNFFFFFVPGLNTPRVTLFLEGEDCVCFLFRFPATWADALRLWEEG